MSMSKQEVKNRFTKELTEINSSFNLFENVDNDGFKIIVDTNIKDIFVQFEMIPKSDMLTIMAVKITTVDGVNTRKLIATNSYPIIQTDDNLPEKVDFSFNLVESLVTDLVGSDLKLTQMGLKLKQQTKIKSVPENQQRNVFTLVKKQLKDAGYGKEHFVCREKSIFIKTTKPTQKFRIDFSIENDDSKIMLHLQDSEGNVTKNLVHHPFITSLFNPLDIFEIIQNFRTIYNIEANMLYSPGLTTLEKTIVTSEADDFNADVIIKETKDFIVEDKKTFKKEAIIKSITQKIIATLPTSEEMLADIDKSLNTDMKFVIDIFPEATGTNIPAGIFQVGKHKAIKVEKEVYTREYKTNHEIISKLGEILHSNTNKFRCVEVEDTFTFLIDTTASTLKFGIEIFKTIDDTEDNEMRVFLLDSEIEHVFDGEPTEVEMFLNIDDVLENISLLTPHKMFFNLLTRLILFYEGVHVCNLNMPTINLYTDNDTLVESEFDSIKFVYNVFKQLDIELTKECLPNNNYVFRTKAFIAFADGIDKKFYVEIFKLINSDEIGFMFCSTKGQKQLNADICHVTEFDAEYFKSFLTDSYNLFGNPEVDSIKSIVDNKSNNNNTNNSRNNDSIKNELLARVTKLKFDCNTILDLINKLD